MLPEQSKHPVDRAMHMTGDIASYRVEETVDEDGVLTVTFHMDPRPAGYGDPIWSWTGRRDAIPPMVFCAGPESYVHHTTRNCPRLRGAYLIYRVAPGGRPMCKTCTKGADDAS